MTTKVPSLANYSSGVMSLLPLFYVAWADSVLSPSEVKLIKEKINEMPFLSKEDKQILNEWCNPQKAPSDQLFRHWVTLIRSTSSQMNGNSRQSLVDLGIEMAKKSAGEADELSWSSDKTREALEEIENVLGIASLEVYRNIFTKEQREKEVAEIVNKPGFDVDKLTAILDDDYADFRNRMRTLLKDPVFRYETLRDKEAYRNKVMDWCKILADQGIGAISYGKDYGGKDDMGSYVVSFEMLGYHDLSLAIKFGVQFGLFGGSILFLGTKKHHDKYLKDTGTLDLAGCFAMTETGHGSNVRGLETTITYNKESDEFVVHSPNESAGKEYIGNALHGQMASVFGQLIVDGQNHGVHAILVPMRDENGHLKPGVRVEDCGYKLGLNGVDNGRIWFDQVKVPRHNLLNKYGDVNEQGVYTSPIENPSKRFFTMLGTLVGGRVSVPRAGLSATKSALTIAIRYALKRRQFASKDGEAETLLLDYPTHQKRLMPRLAKTYALDIALSYLAKRYVNRTEKDIREIETLAAGLKSYATWFTTDTIQECREACGGKGYLAENRFADLKADTDIFTTFEGDNTVLMQLVAKGRLSDYKQAFHDDGFWAVLRHVKTQVSSSLTELNPFFTRNTDADHICDDAFHMEAFQYREQELLSTLAQRMRGMIGKRMDLYDAFLRCQTHMVELANAFVERVILEQFVATVKACDDEPTRKVLKRLCDLFALDTIQKHKGWYLEKGYMEGTKTKAIRRMVNKLCKDIRIESGALVDAFAIPDECLAAPIIL